MIPKIIEYIGFGKNVDGYIYAVSGMNQCRQFIDLLLPYLIVKKNEVLILKNYIETSKYTDVYGYDNKIHNYRHYLAYLMSKEKHENEDYEPVNEPELFLSYQRKLENENEMEQKIRELRKIHQYEEKSLKMMGDGNHRKGIILSEEIKMKMGKSITISKRKDKEALSDENIELIKQMRKDKMKQEDIITYFEEKGMNLTRDNIRNITNGKIVPISNIEDRNKSNEKNDTSLSHSTITSLGKRNIEGSLNFLERIEIMLFKRDLLSKTSIRYNLLNTYAIQTTPKGERKKQLGIPLLSVYLSNKFDKNVSVHIIKNMWDGRCLLLENEFVGVESCEINYQEYLQIIQMKFK
jgi:hypothetical protein